MMKQWKPGRVQENLVTSANKKIWTHFLSRASIEEREILETYDQEAVEFFLYEGSLMARFRFYVSLDGHYLEGAKERHLFPDPEECVTLINTLTRRERRALANAFTADFYPNEERKRIANALLSHMQQSMPYAVKFDDEGGEESSDNAEWIKHLKEIHDRFLSNTDASLFFVPREYEESSTSEAILDVTRVILERIVSLTDTAKDRHLIDWVSDGRGAMFVPNFNYERGTVRFVIEEEVFQRLSSSIQAGYNTVSLTKETIGLFQEWIDGLSLEQRLVVAEDVAKIPAETVQESYLDGRVPLLEAIKLRTELLKRIRDGSLSER